MNVSSKRLLMVFTRRYMCFTFRHKWKCVYVNHGMKFSLKKATLSGKNLWVDYITVNRQTCTATKGDEILSKATKQSAFKISTDSHNILRQMESLQIQNIFFSTWYTQIILPWGTLPYTTNPSGFDSMPRGALLKWNFPVADLSSCFLLCDPDLE